MAEVIFIVSLELFILMDASFSRSKILSGGFLSSWAHLICFLILSVHFFWVCGKLVESSKTGGCDLLPDSVQHTVFPENFSGNRPSARNRDPIFGRFNRPLGRTRRESRVFFI